MILSDIKRYLISHKQASLFDIAQNFKSDENVIEAMLKIWVDKGKVKLSDNTDKSASPLDEETINDEDFFACSDYETESVCEDKTCNSCSDQNFCSSTLDFLSEDEMISKQKLYIWVG